MTSRDSGSRHIICRSEDTQSHLQLMLGLELLHLRRVPNTGILQKLTYGRFKVLP